MLKAKVKEMERLFGFKFPLDAEMYDQRIVPYTKAPVVTQKGFRMMNFSLIPSWSKEKKPKFATHNARLESITEKATWKKPFQSKHCLVPLTTFIEPIYENEMAGNMVQFNSPDGHIMVAAGIYDEWINKETGEVVESFAIITSEPPEFVKTIGHDRCPFFINESVFKDWLETKQQNPSEVMQLLKNAKITPPLTVAVDRPLKPGWEKRA